MIMLLGLTAISSKTTSWININNVQAIATEHDYLEGKEKNNNLCFNT